MTCNLTSSILLRDVSHQFWSNNGSLEIERKALFIRNVKNFERPEYFSFFKQIFERKKSLAQNKKFPAFIKETKKKKTLGARNLRKK